MAFKTILTYFRNETEAPELAAAAGILAEQNDAHVIGLSVAPSKKYFPVLGFSVPEEIIEAATKHHAEKSQAIKTVFDEQAGKGAHRWEWQQIESEGLTVAQTVADRGRCADLIVIGQPSKDTSYVVPDMTFETALIESGKPVLVIPTGHVPRTIGKSVVIAWNAKREAARAAFDALSLLKAAQAENVTIVCAESRVDQLRESNLGNELARTLARHDLNVDVLQVPIEDGPGQTLLQQASELNADLLVMGCYGHSRIREFVFGGATDHVLQNMEIPVLMAH
ncbi:MAG: universal stress protein [Pseudomonadota bacterium]